MKSIAIVGCGAQGGPCATIISRILDVESIVLADLDVAGAEAVKEKIGDKRISVKKLDASDLDSVREAIRGADVAINLVNPNFNPVIMEACLAEGCHYVDTSIGDTMDLDLNASDNILSRMMHGRDPRFHAEFKEKGLSCMIGCGASPGLTNVFARYLSDKYDTVDSVKIRFGKRSRSNAPKVIAAWLPTWSPERALWGYAIRPVVFTGGKFETFDIYSGYEEFLFPEPTGIIPLVYHQHPEQITIPYYLKAKKIQYCDFKYTIDRELGTLILMGFGDKAPVDVKGAKVSPHELLMKIVRRPSGNFMDESAAMQEADIPIHMDASVIVESGSGKIGDEAVGRRVRSVSRIDYHPTLYNSVEERKALFETFGSSQIHVALPAVITAILCSAGKAPSGVAGIECIVPVLFLETLQSHGLKLNYTESHSESVLL